MHTYIHGCNFLSLDCLLLDALPTELTRQGDSLTIKFIQSPPRPGHPILRNIKKKEHYRFAKALHMNIGSYEDCQELNPS